MKTIYFVRHAKSSWKYDVIDHERPLKSRGITDAGLVSSYVAPKLIAPQKIFSSNATRALSTAEFFKKAWNISETDFSTHYDLYDFSGQQVLDFISDIDNALTTVMIVGHNHALTSIVNMLGDRVIDLVPTSGFVILQFETNSWKSLQNGSTLKTVFPRDLK